MNKSLDPFFLYQTGGNLTLETVYDNYYKPEINFIGLFDTVGSFGRAGDSVEAGLDISVAPNIRISRHAVAKDESRYGFPLSSTIDPTNPNDPRIVERIFSGVHGDIGRTYLDDDSLANDPLYWIYQEAKKAGVPLNAYPENFLPVPSYEREKSPKYDTVRQAYAAIYTGKDKRYRYKKPNQGDRTVHDSRYFSIINTPRDVIFRSNKRVIDSDVASWKFEPVILTSPQYEEYMRNQYSKPYWNVTEDYDKP
jgi:hypothetical protein